MKRIAITQRVDIDTERNERRDALDQRWLDFLHACDCLPLLMPNQREQALRLLDEISIEGILLTGGNNLLNYGGDAPERDSLELALLQLSMDKGLPLIGVCRGMQLIQHFFSVELQCIENHVALEHTVRFSDHSSRITNSYHRYGATESVDELSVTARAGDNIIEAIQHRTFPIHGIMWHPERKNPFCKEDLRWFKKIFRVNS